MRIEITLLFQMNLLTAILILLRYPKATVIKGFKPELCT